MGKVISIIMGSQSDLDTLKEAINLLKEFKVSFEVKVLSAHRSPRELAKYVEEAPQRGIKIFIAAAGGAAALSGVIAAHTTRPVIGIPIETKSLKGIDSLLSTVQMPAGVPVACMSIGKAGSKNAAIFALEILSITDKKINSKLNAHKNKARLKIKKIKILILDVDGIMTDGSIIYDDNGKETKVFDVRDGHGIKMLMNAGVYVAIITARKSGVVKHRAKNLGIKMVYQKAMDKVIAFNDILAKTSLKPENAAYMGDELVDISILKRAGFSITVPDGVPEVKAVSDYITKMPGGKGAVREICELILKVQGKWENIIKRYLAP